MAATDASTQRKTFVSGTTTLIISNEDMEDIIKIVNLLKNQVYLYKELLKQLKNKGKGQKGGLLQMLFSTLAASLLGSTLTGQGVITSGEGTIRAEQNFNSDSSFS